MKKSTVSTRLVGFIAFTLIFALLLSLFTMLYLPKWNCETSEVGQVSGFYQEPENTIDVLGLGSCNMFSTFSPVILYEKYGITAYNMCCPDQEESTSYYYIQEALKTQDLKVVFIESLFFTANNGSHREHYNRFAVDYLPPSANKVKLAEQIAKTETEHMQKYDSTAPDKLLTFFGYIFPLLRYHGRTDLTQNDLTFFAEHDLYNFYKGGYPQYTYTTNDDNFYSKIYNGSAVNDTAREFFPKIVDLCAENNIQLVVIKSPNYARWGYDDAQTKLVRDFVASYNIPFVDLHSAELNDFEDYDYGYSTGRLNVYGMSKVSEKLGQYLVENYGLTATTLSDENRALWDACVEKYYAVAAEKNFSLYPGQIAELRNSEDGITVRWNKSDNAATYSVYRCEKKSGVYSLLTAEATGVTYNDTDVVSGNGYTYYIVPNEGSLAGQKSDTKYGVFVAMPEGFTAKNDDGAIVLNWTPSDSAQKYNLQRRKAVSFNFENWDTVKSTTYRNATTDTGSRYYYRLRAMIVEDGVKYYSHAVVADALAQVTPCLTSCTDNDGKAVVKWDSIKNAGKIMVWRRAANEDNYSLIAKVSGSDTKYTDKTVTKGTEYFYRITYSSTSMGLTAESAQSNTISVKIRK